MPRVESAFEMPAGLGEARLEPGGRPSRSRPFSKPQAGMPPGSEEDDALDDALAGPPVDAPASAGVVGKRGDGGRRWMPIAAHSPS